MGEITLVGYGNQGKAWASNLRDSGWKVTVCGRAGGRGIAAAIAAGFPGIEPHSLAALKGPIALLLPDESISDFFRQYLSGGKGRQFLFAHGFAVTFSSLPVDPSDDLILVAPKGIGQKLRENYVAGSGVLGVLAVAQDGSGKAWQTADSVAEGLGLKRVGVIQSTFSHETKADLLSEQVILCGAVPRLVRDTIEFLVQKGIDRKLATYECLNELELIAGMMVEHGLDGMLERVSNAAYVGGKRAADRILPQNELRERTEGLWQEIDSGAFARSLQSQGKISRTAKKEENNECT